ncbi:hypothetical protein XBFM1_1280003 [Xenorhabdus bovienii str. feltiae Moldova]|uniref:Uncharacterized protein n=2 Tax=Xenorhabdus bovienii TaxID=40576 RepID=A0A077PRK9_XENBV|nr:hypothetical protein XBFM1_1280003 [Xenorhabdus bovienii str. feltiae Moldova]CDH23162.1 hypothetical protein XBKB1_1510034 [Xenorhabdus bovienii str. kraussei Becker Underwood]
MHNSMKRYHYKGRKDLNIWPAKGANMALNKKVLPVFKYHPDPHWNRGIFYR